MTHRRLTKEERRVKNLLLNGNSCNKVSNLMGQNRRRTKRIVNRLVYYGEIRAIPGTRNPVIYEDPNHDRFYPPMGDSEGINTPITRGVLDFEDPVSPQHGLDRDLEHLLELATRPHAYPDADTEFQGFGVSIAAECPDGYVEAHISGGQVKLEVIRRGDLDDLKDSKGFTIGYWSEKGRPRGFTETWSLSLRIFNQEVTAQFRVSTKGNLTFLLYLSRFYIDPARFDSQEAVLDAFVDRAQIVTHLLMKHGWAFANPQISGKVEYAVRDHPLVGIFQGGQVPSDADYFIDTSFGVPEVEMKDVTDYEKVDIWAKAPSHILTQQRRSEAMAHEIASLKEEQLLIKERQATMILAVDGLMDVIRRQSELIDGLVENTNRLIMVGSNLTTHQITSEVRSVETVYTSLDGDVPSEQSQQSNKNRLEGYN